MERTSTTSKNNIKIADKIVIEEKVGGFCVIRTELKGNFAYVSGRTSLIHFASVGHARRAVRRVRRDIEPTTI